MTTKQEVQVPLSVAAYDSYIKRCGSKTKSIAVRADDLLKILDQLCEDLGIPAGKLPPDIQRVYITADQQVHKHQNPGFRFYAPALLRSAREASSL